MCLRTGICIELCKKYFGPNTSLVSLNIIEFRKKFFSFFEMKFRPKSEDLKVKKSKKFSMRLKLSVSVSVSENFSNNAKFCIRICIHIKVKET